MESNNTTTGIITGDTTASSNATTYKSYTVRVDRGEIRLMSQEEISKLVRSTMAKASASTSESGGSSSSHHHHRSTNNTSGTLPISKLSAAQQYAAASDLSRRLSLSPRALHRPTPIATATTTPATSTTTSTDTTAISRRGISHSPKSRLFQDFRKAVSSGTIPSDFRDDTEDTRRDKHQHNQSSMPESSTLVSKQRRATPQNEEQFTSLVRSIGSIAIHRDYDPQDVSFTVSTEVDGATPSMMTLVDPATTAPINNTDTAIRSSIIRAKFNAKRKKMRRNKNSTNQRSETPSSSDIETTVVHPNSETKKKKIHTKPHSNHDTNKRSHQKYNHHHMKQQYSWSTVEKSDYEDHGNDNYDNIRPDDDIRDDVEPDNGNEGYQQRWNDICTTSDENKIRMDQHHPRDQQDNHDVGGLVSTTHFDDDGVARDTEASKAIQKPDNLPKNDETSTLATKRDVIVGLDFNTLLPSKQLRTPNTSMNNEVVDPTYSTFNISPQKDGQHGLSNVFSGESTLSDKDICNMVKHSMAKAKLTRKEIADLLNDTSTSTSPVSLGEVGTAPNRRDQEKGLSSIVVPATSSKSLSPRRRRPLTMHHHHIISPRTTATPPLLEDISTTAINVQKETLPAELVVIPISAKVEEVSEKSISDDAHLPEIQIEVSTAPEVQKDEVVSSRVVRDVVENENKVDVPSSAGNNTNNDLISDTDVDDHDEGIEVVNNVDLGIVVATDEEVDRVVDNAQGVFDEESTPTPDPVEILATTPESNNDNNQEPSMVSEVDSSTPDQKQSNSCCCFQLCCAPIILASSSEEEIAAAAVAAATTDLPTTISPIQNDDHEEPQNVGHGTAMPESNLEEKSILEAESTRPEHDHVVCEINSIPEQNIPMDENEIPKNQSLTPEVEGQVNPSNCKSFDANTLPNESDIVVVVDDGKKDDLAALIVSDDAPIERDETSDIVVELDVTPALPTDANDEVSSAKECPHISINRNISEIALEDIQRLDAVEMECPKVPVDEQVEMVEVAQISGIILQTSNDEKISDSLISNNDQVVESDRRLKRSKYKSFREFYEAKTTITDDFVNEVISRKGSKMSVFELAEILNVISTKQSERDEAYDDRESTIIDNGTIDDAGTIRDDRSDIEEKNLESNGCCGDIFNLFTDFDLRDVDDEYGSASYCQDESRAVTWVESVVDAASKGDATETGAANNSIYEEEQRTQVAVYESEGATSLDEHDTRRLTFSFSYGSSYDY